MTTPMLTFYANFFVPDYTPTGEELNAVSDDFVRFRTFALNHDLYNPMVHDDDEIDTNLLSTIIDECTELEADGSNAVCKSCSDSIGITVPVEGASDDENSEPDSSDPTRIGVMLDLPAIELQVRCTTNV